MSVWNWIVYAMLLKCSVILKENCLCLNFKPLCLVGLNGFVLNVQSCL